MQILTGMKIFEKGNMEIELNQTGLQTFKVCNEKNFQHSGAYISVGIHFTENLKVPAERS